VPSTRLWCMLFTGTLVLEMSPWPGISSDVSFFRWCLVVAPPASHFIVCLLLAMVKVCTGVGPEDMQYGVLASIALFVTAIEMSLMLEDSMKLCVLLHKYCCIRAFLDMGDGVVAHRFGGCSLTIFHDACRLWTFSWRWGRDLLLGSLLTFSNLFISMIPCCYKCHSFFLFQTRAAKEETAEEIEANNLGSYNNLEDAQLDDALLMFFKKFAPQVFSAATTGAGKAEPPCAAPSTKTK